MWICQSALYFSAIQWPTETVSSDETVLIFCSNQNHNSFWKYYMVSGIMNIWYLEDKSEYLCVCVKACPPCSLEVCALRMQLFIGLRSVCVHGRHVILLSTADTETPEESERATQRRGL